MNFAGSEVSYADTYIQPIRHFIDDPSISEVLINPDGKVWIEKAGSAYCQQADISFSLVQTQRLCEALASRTSMKFNSEAPLFSATTRFETSGNIRFQATMAPATKAPTLTIRTVAQRQDKQHEIEFLFEKSMSAEAQRQTLLKNIQSDLNNKELNSTLKKMMQHRLNILISGATSSGKTTLAGQLMNMIDLRERLIVIEDGQELFPTHENRVAMQCDNENGLVTPTKILRAALRMRPDRIFLGELRGDEALTFVNAINTGHGGSFTTIHADTAQRSLDRLAQLVLSAGTAMTYDNIVQEVSKTIDVVIQMGRDNDRRGIFEIWFPG